MTPRPAMTADRAALLRGWLDQACARDWDWPVWNCILAPADWALLSTGLDPAAAWRGDCQDEAAARAVVRRAGGLTRLAATSLEPLGWVRTRTPGGGAVGVVRPSVMIDRGVASGRVGFRTAFGGVCLGKRWAIASSDGVMVEPARVVAAWEYPNG